MRVYRHGLVSVTPAFTALGGCVSHSAAKGVALWGLPSCFGRAAGHRRRNQSFFVPCRISDPKPSERFP